MTEKQYHTNADHGKLAPQQHKEEGSASHSEDKCITKGLQNSETESETSEHNYFVLEKSVKDSDDHQLENCDMEYDDHRRDSTPQKIATARDHEDCSIQIMDKHIHIGNV